MAKQYEIKVRVMGRDDDMDKEIRVPNRTLACGANGITYELDQRHAEIIVREMHVEKGKTVTTPALPDDEDIIKLRESNERDDRRGSILL